MVKPGHPLFEGKLGENLDTHFWGKENLEENLDTHFFEEAGRRTGAELEAELDILSLPSLPCSSG
jgi:hypothetical protein